MHKLFGSLKKHNVKLERRRKEAHHIKASRKKSWKFKSLLSHAHR